jgi:hypothetical protein
LAGVASPSFRNGRHSKQLPGRLLERYTQALQDRTLLELRDEIAVLDARLSELLSQLDPDAPAPNRREQDRALWTEIRETMERRRRLTESERRRLVQMQQMMSVEQAMVFVAALADIARKYVPDREALAAMTRDLAALLEGPRD